MALKLVTNLATTLEECLTNTEEIWIAIALTNDDGFFQLQQLLPPNIVQHYLLGVDLPTSPLVLHQLHDGLQPGKIEAGIYQESGGTFHPKLFLFKYKEHYAAIIGSANLTGGGLGKNTELGIWTDETQPCADILKWFKKLQDSAYPLSDENIANYERWMTHMPLKPNINTLPKLKLIRQNRLITSIDHIDFDDRFFKKEHHLAFREELWLDDSPEANKARKRALDRFVELHEEIFPDFSAHQLNGLHPNIPQHLVSMAYHFPGRTQQALNAMWLSYGKSKKEIESYHRLFPGTGKYGQNEEDDLQSFINHTRLQIRIELTSIGIWILFAKNNGGGLFDRNEFRERMKEANYRQKIHTLLKELPSPYWIRVNDDKRYVSEITDPNALHEFCKRDNDRHYFTIGRDYSIDAPEMSAERLPKETLQEFKRLYPLYRVMRHYLPIGL